MKKVLLGMSGGNDSSAAAALLLQQGYDVTGITFRFFEHENNTEYLNRAAKLANTLGFPHYIIDARKMFEETIIDYFVNEYFNGRTPVPCTICNNKIKWHLLMREANKHNCPVVATGHYANIEKNKDTFYISEATDLDKDQSFFLWGLDQNRLSRIIFPLGSLLYNEVKHIAKQNGYIHSESKNSIGVCFSPGDYRKIIKDKAGERNKRIEKGVFVDEKGNLIGYHEGFPFYTVGQRRGLGINLNKPLYVKEIHPATNQIVLSPASSLFKESMSLIDTSFHKNSDFIDNPDIKVRIRYRKQETSCHIHLKENHEADVFFHEPVSSVVSGQSAVFYSGNRVIGGGIIK